MSDGMKNQTNETKQHTQHHSSQAVQFFDITYFVLNIDKEIKRRFWRTAQEKASKMYDRQGDGMLPGTHQRRTEKIYAGMIAEFAVNQNLEWFLGLHLEHMVNDNGYIIHRPLNRTITHGDMTFDIKADGLTQSKKDVPDEFDLMVNGVSIDVKSSIEKSFVHTPKQYQNMALEKRNFTLPQDQRAKDLTIQVLFTKGEDGKINGVFCFNAATKQQLESAPVVLLKTHGRNNTNTQPTHMLPLKFGQPLRNCIPHQPPTQSLENKANVVQKTHRQTTF